MINRILIWIALAFSVVALGIAIQHGSVPSATPAHRLGASNQCFVNDPTTQGLLGFPTLTSAVTTAVQSTIQVSSTAAFAQCVGRTFQVRIDNEVLVVTGAVGLTLSVIRGADNSIPTLHSVGATVSGVITAGGLSALNPFAALDGGAGNLLTLFDGGTYGWQSPIPLPGNVLAVYPIDGVSDDWATLMQVTLPAAIAAGQWVELMPGPAGQQWIIGSRQTVPNHARIAINHSAVVHSTLTPNGSRSYAFAAYPTYGAQAQISGRSYCSRRDEHHGTVYGCGRHVGAVDSWQFIGICKLWIAAASDIVRIERHELHAYIFRAAITTFSERSLRHRYDYGTIGHHGAGEQCTHLWIW